MRSVLVLAEDAALSAALRVVLDPGQYRVVHQRAVLEIDSALPQTSVDVCILDAELTTIEPIRTIQRLRSAMPHCPILIYATTKQWEWEEEAYLLGVTHVLSKPVRARLLNTLLDRLWSNQSPDTPLSAGPRPAQEAVLSEPATGPFQTLEVLRDFSGVLKHSLHSQELLKQFLLLLREILGVNRAAIFLRKPPNPLSTALQTDRGLTSACAIGIAPGLLENLKLSTQAGIGGYLYRRGRILKSSSEEARADREIQKEFELLGAQVAIPVLDRESLVGVAVFDGPLTGEALTKEELALLFHLLEELGLAIRNSWLHDHLVASHDMMTNIFSQIKSGCVVIGSDLAIVHANDPAKHYFAKSGQHASALDFSDLPQSLGSKVFQSLKTGLGLPPFRYRFPTREKRSYQVTISPFKDLNSGAVNAVLLLLEDVTQFERAQQLEIESANLRLVKSMAERLAHEIGNAIMPLSIHEELLKHKYQEAEYRESLADAMRDSVKRISRLARQMFFLARETFEPADTVSLQQLLEEAFRQAKSFHSDAKGRLRFEHAIQPITLKVDRSGVKHALSEVMLNALQANSSDSEVIVSAGRSRDAEGRPRIDIEISDLGAGFPPETAGQALNPFYTTRTVGIGLGLTVAKKIIEKHHGTIEISPTARKGCNPVRISLPTD